MRHWRDTARAVTAILTAAVVVSATLWGVIRTVNDGRYASALQQRQLEAQVDRLTARSDQAQSDRDRLLDHLEKQTGRLAALRDDVVRLIVEVKQCSGR